MSKVKKAEKKKTTGRTLHYYLAEIWKYKWRALIILILTPLTAIIEATLGPVILSDIIGKISNGVTEAQIWSELVPEAGWFLGCFALNNICLVGLKDWLVARLELLVIRDLDRQCFEVICNKSMQFHNERFSGALVALANRFGDAFGRFADEIVWNIIPFVTKIISIIIVLWPVAPIFASGIIVLVLAYLIISGLTFRKISYLNSKESAALSKQSGQLSDATSNIIAVKSYAKEKFEQKRYMKFQNKVFKAGSKTMRAMTIRNIWFAIANVMMMALLLLFAMFGQIWLGVSIATLVLIFSYSQTVFSNLWSVPQIFRNLSRVFGDAKEMTVILDETDEVVDIPEAKKLDTEKGEVVFREISFRHADARREIFQNFNLKVQAGERVGLVGASGSGKTTLTKLLLRFADITAGEILVDGQNISQVKQDSLREAIAYVPQETALFHRSVTDNIAYAKPNTTREEIVWAAKQANADEFIRDLPEGYETLVGERGVKLSGGQRQRIAIARAILKDAPILVLDEATSALDSESEGLIQEALEKLMEGRTTLVIAHRLSTVANLDRIVVLENGKIVEEGAHGDLLAKGGAYYKLWTKQSGEFL